MLDKTKSLANLTSEYEEQEKLVSALKARVSSMQHVLHREERKLRGLKSQLNREWKTTKLS